MTTLRHLPILLMAIVLCLASCDKQEDIDRAYTDYRYDIVTYLGQNATGAVFEYIGHGDSASIKLQSRVDVSEDAKVNERVLLRYDYADTREGGMRDIDVFSCSGIISDSLRVTNSSPDSLPRHAVKLRSLWRTGDFINLHCQVEYTNQSRTFMLVVDGSTIGQDTVDCYLVHDLMGKEGTFWRDCYASFNVGALWHRKTVGSVRLWLNDVTYPETEYYIFTK